MVERERVRGCAAGKRSPGRVRREDARGRARSIRIVPHDCARRVLRNAELSLLALAYRLVRRRRNVANARWRHLDGDGGLASVRR